MTDIRLAQIYAFYLFDVAETVDLSAIPALIGGPTVAARLAPKSPLPPTSSTKSHRYRSTAN